MSLNRMHTHKLNLLQEYYSDEEESGLSQDQADEEVAVTKRGRAVKLPAKYKAEVSTLHLHCCYSTCACSCMCYCAHMPVH